MPFSGVFLEIESCAQVDAPGVTVHHEIPIIVVIVVMVVASVTFVTIGELHLGGDVLGDVEGAAEPQVELGGTIVIIAIIVAMVVVPFTFKYTELELETGVGGEPDSRNGIASFETHMGFQTAIKVVMFKCPKQTCFGANLESRNLGVGRELSTQVEGKFISGRGVCYIAVVVPFGSTGGEVQVQEGGNHGGHFKSATNGKVADAITTVDALVAVTFVPELIAPAL